MDEKALKAEARLVVLEYMLQRLYMFVYGIMHVTSDDIRRAHQKLPATIGKESFSETDPAFSMLIGGELEDALGNFLGGLESMLAEVGLLKNSFHSGIVDRFCDGFFSFFLATLLSGLGGVLRAPRRVALKRRFASFSPY
jgi:hypothetical protein